MVTTLGSYMQISEPGVVFAWEQLKEWTLILNYFIILQRKS
jgi:hypothetical protein